jgi:hypothetical protein
MTTTINPFYCLQVTEGMGDSTRHCSLNENPGDRKQCETCHDIERERAAEASNLYAKRRALPPPVEIETDPLAEIARICKSLTYGEMMEFGSMLEKYRQPEGMAETIYQWSESYAMDRNNPDNNLDISSDLSNSINDLYVKGENSGES